MVRLTSVRAKNFSSLDLGSVTEGDLDHLEMVRSVKVRAKNFWSRGS